MKHSEDYLYHCKSCEKVVVNYTSDHTCPVCGSKLVYVKLYRKG